MTTSWHANALGLLQGAQAQQTRGTLQASIPSLSKTGSGVRAAKGPLHTVHGGMATTHNIYMHVTCAGSFKSRHSVDAKYGRTTPSLMVSLAVPAEP